MGGTGGHFLSSFLTYAKYKILFNKLSTYGNAHDNIQEVESEKFLMKDFVDKTFNEQLDYLKTLKTTKFFSKLVNLTPPYFISVHSIHQDLFTTEFDKTILVSYEKSDIETIAKVYALKRGYDILNGDIRLVRSLYKQQLESLSKNIDFYKEKPIKNILYIKWQELLSLESDKFESKLSDFLNMKMHFNRRFLDDWRTGCQKCIQIDLLT